MVKAISAHITFLIIFIMAQCIYCQNGLKEDQLENEKSKTRTIHSIKLKTGKEISSVTASDNENTFYIVDIEGEIGAFNLQNYEQIWNSKLGGETASNVLELKDTVFFITKVISDKSQITHTMWSIDKSTGITKKHTSINGQGNFLLWKDINNNILIINKSCYLMMDSDLNIFSEFICVDQNSDSLDSSLNKPFLDEKNNKLYLISVNQIFIVNLSSKVSNSAKIYKQTSPISSYTITDNQLLVGDEKGNLTLLNNADTNRSWKFRVGGKVSDIDILGDKVFVSSFDNFLYCLELTTGDLLWKKRFPGRITRVQKYDDNTISISNSYSDTIYYLSISSGLKNYKIIIPDTLSEERVIKSYQTTRLIINQHFNSLDIIERKPDN